jgi:hypothetical protein
VSKDGKKSNEEDQIAKKASTDKQESALILVYIGRVASRIAN